MTDEQRTFEHSAAIESLADTLIHARCPLEPEQLFIFLQMQPATLRIIEKLIVKVFSEGWNGGAAEAEVGLLDYREQSRD